MTKKLQDKKILMVIAKENFRDEELTEPKRIFEAEGAKVTVASNSVGKCVGMFKTEVSADIAVASALSKDYDSLVISGGSGAPQYIWHNEDLHKLIKAFRGEGKTTHAICLSPAVLAITGVLEGKRATVYAMPESLAEFEKGGVKYVNEPVVVDGDIVTGRDPDAAEEFAKKVTEILSKK